MLKTVNKYTWKKENKRKLSVKDNL